MHVSTMQQFIGFIYGIGLVLSCQMQDDLSLYYNMLAVNGKNMDQKMQGNQCKQAREISAHTKKSQRTAAHMLQVRG